MEDYSAGRRAAAYWFIDGLPPQHTDPNEPNRLTTLFPNEHKKNENVTCGGVWLAALHCLPVNPGVAA